MAFEFIEKELINQHHQHLYRKTYCVEKNTNGRITIDSQQYVNFSSNDYLGLNNHPAIQKALQEGAELYGVSSSASNLVTGYSYAHSALEATICDWLNKPAAMLYPSGFSANEAVISALGQQNTMCLLDKLSHASIIDGALGSHGKTKRYLHNDYAQLEMLCQRYLDHDKLIISEGVFSMDGDRANASLLSNIAKQYQALSYLDEAHSIGIAGEYGQGLGQECDIVMATCGKALATAGAFVACSKQIKEYLINFSRHYIYSTAISPALAWSTKASIELVQQEHWRRDKVNELSNLFKARLDPSINLLPSQSSIHAIVIKDEEKALQVSEQLKKQGLWVTAIRPPTVAKGTSRLRITICINHNANNINNLTNALNEVLV